MRRLALLLLSFVLLASAPVFAEDAAAADAGGTVQNAGAWSRPVPLFDRLNQSEDVIYLITNSSFIWGPDPHGLSEEVTFTGFVTVPKWPQPGYQRRTLPDGRQQIDIELSHSDLFGASYLLGGDILLGEHPDLRSLGTITEAPLAEQAAYLRERSAHAVKAANQGVRSGAAVQTAGAERRTFMITRELAQLVEANQDVLWSDLIASELRKLSKVPAAQIRSQFPAQELADPVALDLNLPNDLAERLSGSGIDLNGVVGHLLKKIAGELGLPNQDVMTLVVPADFIVARKVLLNTAKGVLYNETAVPVRGKLDEIPPVRRKEDAVGLNVFRGMELPIPLLDKDKNVDGWFYSKAHLAMSVRPQAVSRDGMEATLRLRVGNKTETVKLTGRGEIHHGESRTDAAGQRQTEVEFIILALRGQSEILGDQIMIIEAFSDRDKFSKGWVTWADGKPVPSSLDLFVELLTPSGKLLNSDPLRLAGTVDRFSTVGALTKGSLSVPLLKTVSPTGLATSAPVTLFNEAERPVVTVESIDIRFVDHQVADVATAAAPAPESR
jgi:hypothetical protein